MFPFLKGDIEEDSEDLSEPRHSRPGESISAFVDRRVQEMGLEDIMEQARNSPAYHQMGEALEALDRGVPLEQVLKNVNRGKS